jgi:hypothetical protein
MSLNESNSDLFESVSKILSHINEVSKSEMDAGMDNLYDSNMKLSLPIYMKRLDQDSEQV